MGLLTSRLSKLRDDPRLLGFPPYLALLCMLGGIAWMLLLPLDEYSRRTYISENALLPGQVHTYFHGSEQNVFRAYRHEIANVLEPKSVDDEHGQPTGQYLVATDSHRTDRIESVFHNAGLKTARQTFSYESSGKTYSGENVYAIVHGPRADGTESIVLVAPIRNIEDQLNVNGVTLLLALARYFSRWSLWSKDIILLVTPDSRAGPQAWVDAYHSTHDPSKVADLSLKSGHIQGAIVVDYPFKHSFETLHVAYDGINGQLPNLDLMNTAVSIASGQMGIGTTIQSQHKYAQPDDQGKYLVRLKTLIRGMASQALGHSTGAHSVFMPYHIDAITLTAVGEGWQDEMAFGRVVESTTRSLNNLLEKLHQSFFFYLLLQNTRFVSIGTYLPSAMAVGAGFTIVAIWRWLSGGYKEQDPTDDNTNEKETEKKESGLKNDSDMPRDFQTKAAGPISLLKNSKPKPRWEVIDRPLILPTAILATVHLSSMLTIYLLSDIHTDSLLLAFSIRCLQLFVLPAILARRLNNRIRKTATVTKTSSPRMTIQERKTQLYTILSSLSLLILGLELTVLATLNFSLSIILGLISSPLAFISYRPSPTSSKPSSVLSSLRTPISLIILIILSPPTLILLSSVLELNYLAPYRAPIGILGRVREYLEAEAFAFNIWGCWGTVLGVWAIWVPGWVVGMTGIMAGVFDGGIARSEREKGAKK